MSDQEAVRDAIVGEGNGGLHIEEIVALTQLPESSVKAAIREMARVLKVAECEPGCWMVRF